VPRFRGSSRARSRAENLVETGRELAVAVADQEAWPLLLIGDRHDQLARPCCATQSPFGLAVTPARCTRRRMGSMKKRTYSLHSQSVSTVKTSHSTIPAAC
jgi:hypothetical protein